MVPEAAPPQFRNRHCNGKAGADASSDPAAPAPSASVPVSAPLYIFAAGILTVGDLKAGPAACTLRPSRISHALAPKRRAATRSTRVLVRARQKCARPAIVHKDGNVAFYGGLTTAGGKVMLLAEAAHRSGITRTGVSCREQTPACDLPVWRDRGATNPRERGYPSPLRPATGPLR